jgi:hypothetical protein
VGTLPHTVLGLCPAEVNMGKGSRPRPYSVSQSEFDNRWDIIFSKGKEMQVRVQEDESKVGQCGCGRSPTGKCIGWHGLSEAEFQKRLLEHQEKNK